MVPGLRELPHEEVERAKENDALIHWIPSKAADGRLFINVNSGIVHRGRLEIPDKTACGCKINESFSAVQGASLAVHDTYCKKCYRQDMVMNDTSEEES